MGILFRRDITRRKVVLSLLLFAMFLPTPAYAYYALAGLERAWYGAGAVISPEGYILTNHHVVEGAEIIVVRMYDENVLEAKIVATLPEFDVAIIKIERKCPAYVPVELVRTPEVGESVVVIGHPEGLPWTVSFGIITGLGRDAPNLGLKGLLQTNAGIAPGSSGGPLIDAYGRLIGVNVCVKTAQGVPLTQFGFAIPVKAIAQWLVAEIPDIARSGRTTEELPLRTIAARYTAATVLIEAKALIPLVELLPKRIPGYEIGIPTSWKAPAEPEQLRPPESLSPKPPGPETLLELLGTPVEIPGKKLADPKVRLGIQPSAYAYVDACRESDGAGKFEVNILVARFPNEADAIAATLNLTRVDMEKLKILRQSRVTVGDLSIDVSIGFATGLEREEFFNPLLQEKRCWKDAFLLRGTLSFQLEGLVIGLSLKWYYAFFESCISGPFALAFTAPKKHTYTQGEYVFDGSCVYLHEEVFEVEEKFFIPFIPPFKPEGKKISEETNKLMCLDTFLKEMQVVLNIVVEWLRGAR